MRNKLIATLGLLLALAGPVCLRAATITYNESNAASDLTAVQTCNSISSQGTYAPQQMVISGAATGYYSFSQAKSLTENFEFYSPASSPVAWKNTSGTPLLSSRCLPRSRAKAPNQAFHLN